MAAAPPGGKAARPPAQPADSHHARKRGDSQQLHSNKESAGAGEGGEGIGGDGGDKENTGAGPKSSWASVVAGNKRVEKGFQLDFHAQLLGSDEVEFDEEEWEPGAEEWKNSLVGFVFGFKAPFFRIKAFIENRWGGPDVVTISEIQKGVFLFRFKDQKVMDCIVSQGPWSFDSKSFVLRPWTPDMSLNFEDISRLPVWIKLPGLNFNLWKPKPLSKITSTIGRPICTDSVTATQERLQFARACVEIDAEHDLVYEITIKGPKGIVLNQKVEYEWVPSRCTKCKVFGHPSAKCTKKVMQRWEVVTKPPNVDLHKEDVPNFVHEDVLEEDDESGEDGESINETDSPSEDEAVKMQESEKLPQEASGSNSSSTSILQSKDADSQPSQNKAKPSAKGNPNVDEEGFNSLKKKKKRRNKKQEVPNTAKTDRVLRSNSHVDQAVNLSSHING